ncbi:hypothetical protein B0H17DRAFT_304474 [Mycena rosella]|uniref:Uncharacterized protein n=1 Tax=Mycena rosella TaxID=1033263 RepID=A0AAD7G7M3_MYCRO|nr:hypothetical protein B0H17DRAFT_304474 [Mycena rosella]
MSCPRHRRRAFGSAQILGYLSLLLRPQLPSPQFLNPIIQMSSTPTSPLHTLPLFSPTRSPRSLPDKILALTTAAGVDIEPIWATLLAKALEGKNVKEMLSTINVGTGPLPLPAPLQPAQPKKSLRRLWRLWLPMPTTRTPTATCSVVACSIEQGH